MYTLFVFVIFCSLWGYINNRLVKRTLAQKPVCIECIIVAVSGRIANTKHVSSERAKHQPFADLHNNVVVLLSFFFNSINYDLVFFGIFLEQLMILVLYCLIWLAMSGWCAAIVCNPHAIYLHAKHAAHNRSATYARLCLQQYSVWNQIQSINDEY